MLLPLPVKENVCSGLIALEVFAAPEGGSLKFQECVNPLPDEVFVKDTGMFEQLLLPVMEKPAVGIGNAMMFT
jgi:hypothetical protein